MSKIYWRIFYVLWTPIRLIAGFLWVNEWIPLGRFGPGPQAGLRVAINSCRDVTTLGRFASAVDPVHWVAQLQSHLESLIENRHAKD